MKPLGWAHSFFRILLFMGRWKVKPNSRQFRLSFRFGDWDEISLGINIGLAGPHIGIYFPFGHMYIGWIATYEYPSGPQLAAFQATIN